MTTPESSRPGDIPGVTYIDLALASETTQDRFAAAFTKFISTYLSRQKRPDGTPFYLPERDNDINRNKGPREPLTSFSIKLDLPAIGYPAHLRSLAVTPDRDGSLYYHLMLTQDKPRTQLYNTSSTNPAFTHWFMDDLAVFVVTTSDGRLSRITEYAHAVSSSGTEDPDVQAALASGEPVLRRARLDGPLLTATPELIGGVLLGIDRQLYMECLRPSDTI